MIISISNEIREHYNYVNNGSCVMENGAFTFNPYLPMYFTGLHDKDFYDGIVNVSNEKTIKDYILLEECINDKI